LTVLEAPREFVHNQALNVGSSSENYQVRDLAETISDVIPGSRITYAAGGSADSRCYRVNCDKLAKLLPFTPQWTVRQGVEQLYSAFRTRGLAADEFLGPRFQRIKTIQKLQSEGRLNSELRWLTQSSRNKCEPRVAGWS
jgi:hypothetical protein